LVFFTYLPWKGGEFTSKAIESIPMQAEIKERFRERLHGMKNEARFFLKFDQKVKQVE